MPWRKQMKTCLSTLGQSQEGQHNCLKFGSQVNICILRERFTRSWIGAFVCIKWAGCCYLLARIVPVKIQSAIGCLSTNNKPVILAYWIDPFLPLQWLVLRPQFLSQSPSHAFFTTIRTFCQNRISSSCARPLGCEASLMAVSCWKGR